MRSKTVLRGLVGGWVALLVGWALPTLGQKLVVHLPSSPLESATRQAEGLGKLSEYLSRQVPGLRLEPQIFRRVRDASEFLGSKPAEVSLVLCDAELLVDLPAGLELLPTHRLLAKGKPTYRRLVVVAKGRSELNRLADLRGKKLAVVEAGGPSSEAWMARLVFEGLLEPRQYFATIAPAADEIAAMNEVLFNQVDAALVADFNPLLAKNLGSTLRVIYTSNELSMPVLAVRSTGLAAEQLQALEKALGILPSQPGGAEILADLGVDGFSPIPAAERERLRTIPGAPNRPLELLGLGNFRLASPAPPNVQDLPLTLDLGLPKRPAFSELLESAASEEPPKKN